MVPIEDGNGAASRVDLDPVREVQQDKAAGERPSRGDLGEPDCPGEGLVLLPGHPPRRRSPSRRRAFVPNALDDSLLHLLANHRVLTTRQLMAATGSPERTVDHRLMRLRQARLVERARPYRERGSAPFHWWLTAAGLRLVGRDTTTRTTVPSVHFLAHTSAVAGVWLALAAADRIEVRAWRREEEAWEEWKRPSDSPWSVRRQRGKVSPDATAQLTLDVDGERAEGAVFVEVDRGTEPLDRLRLKVIRYRHYAADRAWEDRHPHCPVLVVLTTSEARAGRFLALLNRSSAKKGPTSEDGYSAGHDGPPVEPLLVGACGLVDDASRAVVEPVWRAPDGRGRTLADLLADAVRARRRRVAWDAQQAALAAEQAPHRAVWHLRWGQGHIGRHVPDVTAAAALTTALGRYTALPEDEKSSWVEANRDLILAVWDWWGHQPAHNQVGGSAEPAPPTLVARLRALHAEVLAEQTERLLLADEARHLGDPRLVVLASRVTAGELVREEGLRDVERSPVDGEELQDDLLRDYLARRGEHVAAQRACQGWRERRTVTDEEMAGAYDAQHLQACSACGLACPTRRPDPGRCPLCRAPVVGWTERPLLPTPTQAMATLERTQRAGR